MSTTTVLPFEAVLGAIQYMAEKIKFDELTLLLPATQPTVICQTETWFTPSVSETFSK